MIGGLFKALDRGVSRFLAGYDATPGPTDDFWYNDIGSTRKTTAGVSVNENTALNYSACWAATRLLSGSGGFLPFNLNRKLPKGGSEVASEHPLHAILHNEPNPEMSSMMFRCQGLSQQVNWGNTYSEIERDQLGRVRALWPIHPSRCKPVREKKELYYQVTNKDGSKTRLDAYEVFHVPSMMSDDGITGKGVIKAARESIGMGLATERFGAAFFGNGARPGGIVEHPTKLSPQARENFRREWNEIHQGPDNAHNIALLQEGSHFVPFGIPPEEAQFLGTRQHNIEENARWYGVPPHMIQHLLRSTNNNIEAQGIEFVVYSLLPWLKLWEQEVWRKLLTKDEQKTYFAKFVVEGLMRGDTPSRTAALQQQFFNGSLTLDEWREIEDRNPLPDGKGELHWVQSAMMPIDLLIDRAEADVEARKQQAEQIKAATEAANAAAEANKQQTDGATGGTTEQQSGEPATTNTEAAGVGDVQATALNGAQILALLSVTDKLALGQYPPDGAKAVIKAAFPLMEETLVNQIVDSMDGFVPRPPPAPPVAIVPPPPAGEPPPEDVPPEETDESPAEQEQPPQLSAVPLRILLADTLSRMLGVEATAIRRAAAKPQGFLAWMDEFYAKHQPKLAAALAPVEEALAAVGQLPAEWRETLAAEWATRSRAELLEATDAVPAQFAGAVESMLEKWTTRPDGVAQEAAK